MFRVLSLYYFVSFVVIFNALNTYNYNINSKYFYSILFLQRK